MPSGKGLDKGSGLWIVALVAFLVWFSRALGEMLQPLLTQYLGLDPGQIGLLFFFTSIPVFIMRIPVGTSSDKYGRRAFMLAGPAVWSLCGILFFIAERFNDLVAPFIIWGVGISLYFTTSGALIADLTDSEKRMKAYGTVGIFEIFGRFIGPLIGGVIMDGFGIKMAFTALVIPCIVATITSLKLPSPREKRGRMKISESLKQTIRGSVGKVVRVFALLSLISGAYSGMIGPMLPIFFQTSRGLSYSEIGLVNAISMVGAAMGFYISRLIPRRFNLRKIIAYSSLATAVLIVAYTLAATQSTIFIVAFFFGLVTAFGYYSPGGMTLFMSKLPDTVRGSALGIRGTVWRVGNAIGALIMGSLWLSFGILAVFYSCVVLLVMICIIVWTMIPQD